MLRYLLAIVLLCSVVSSRADTALWEVSKGPYKIWLGASLSGLKASAYPLPAEFDDAFRRADKLILERDINAVNQPDFGVRAMQASLYRDGRTLKSVLSSKNWQALEQFSQARGVPVFSLLLFKPAFVGFTLTALEGKNLDLSNGVDAHYFYRAEKNKKPIATLETVDQQLVFLQHLNEVDANLMMKIMLTELTELSASLDQATTQWRAGNMTKLDQLKGQAMRTQVPELYRELVTKRSKAWLPSLRKMLTTAEVELVLVDAIHFGGPNNLLELLAAEGFTIKPYRL